MNRTPARAVSLLPPRTRVVFLLLAMCLLGCGRAVCADDRDATADTLDGAIIADIIIDNRNIFDLDDPREDNFLFRTANLLHIVSWPRVIGRQLLFSPGDAYTRRLADESERILRSNAYLEDARIEAVPRPDGRVDVHVHTIDVWTLLPRVDFGRSGGVNTSTIGFEDHNLAGSGISLGLMHESNIDSDNDSIRIEDREVGGTRYRVKSAYSVSDDGNGYLFELGLPFYALDSRNAHGISLQQEERVDELYDRGDSQAEFGHDETAYRLEYGISPGLRDGWTTRYLAGLGYEEDRFTPGTNPALPYDMVPEDRKFVYPFLGIDIIQDDYAVLINHDQIGRVEDVHMGTHLQLQAGYAGTAFGSLDNALIVNGLATRGFGEPGAESLYTSAGLDMRWQDGGARNLLLRAGADWYHPHSPRRTLYAGLHASIGHKLDLDNPLYLGGDNGLRGYPLRYQGGDSSMLFTLEERYFTSLYLFRLFRIGGAVFFDAGRTWGDNPVGAENLGWLKDVGFGLRIGNKRTGTGKVIHVDLAFPLDGDDSIESTQFLVEAKMTF